MLIPVASIAIGPKHRRVVAGKVKEIALSIETIGLKVPIAVRPGKEAGSYILVAGRHRLEACRRLGRAEIEAEVFEDVLEAHLWEIAENLHRADLTGLQRNLLTGSWVKLRAKKIKLDQKSRVDPGGPITEPLPRKPDWEHGRDNGINAAARELDIPTTTAKRAVKIATRLSKRAQKEAEKLGLENRTHLLERATQSTDPQYQVEVLRRHAEREATRKAELAELDAIRAGTDTPRTPGQKFDRWFWTLDIVDRVEMRIWLLSEDAERHLEELEKIEERLRRGGGEVLH